MKDILGITQYNLAKYNSFGSYQAWKRMLALFKSVKSSRHNEICNLHKQIISLLKALQRKKPYAHYQDILSIRSQNEMIRDMGVKDRKIDRLQQLVHEYQMNEKYSELENAKHIFRRRKNEMLQQLSTAKGFNMHNDEKDMCAVFETLINACNEQKLPRAGKDNIDGEKLLEGYYYNCTKRAQFKNLSNQSIYRTILNFLQYERPNHIDSIQRLEKSIKDLAISYS